LTAKKQPKEEKNELREKEIVYPTVEDIIRINKAVLGKLPPEERDKLPKSTLEAIEEVNAGLKPRDPKRIPEILDSLKKLWEKEPDQRLGQVLENYVFINGKRGDNTSCALFYQEDDISFQNIVKILKIAEKA